MHNALIWHVSREMRDEMKREELLSIKFLEDLGRIWESSKTIFGHRVE